MEKIKYVSLFVILALLLSLMPSAAMADGPEDRGRLSVCSSMPEAQIPGTTPGSACRVPVVAVGKGPQPLRSLYRSGWTNRNTSESDSDLTENRIKVEAWLYYWFSSQWNHEDDCVDQNYWSSHAACSTTGSVVWDDWRQDGYHYFHKTGYVDDNFQTRDEWTT
jgi:hypothetical protein